MPMFETEGVPNASAVRHELLLIAAAVAIIRLDHLRSGIVSQSAQRFVADARGTLQAIKRALEQEPFDSDDGVRLETSRDLLQTLLSDLASGARW